MAQWSGILQAEACGGFGELYAADRNPEPITQALCWAHARRKFFELADIAANARRGKDAPPISPLALEAVKRIDDVFDVESVINGADAGTRSPSGRRKRRRSSPSCTNGCAPSASASPATPPSPRR